MILQNGIFSLKAMMIKKQRSYLPISLTQIIKLKMFLTSSRRSNVLPPTGKKYNFFIMHQFFSVGGSINVNNFHQMSIHSLFAIARKHH